MMTSTGDVAQPSGHPTRKTSRIRRDSLATMVEQAYKLLRHQILHGELEPGTIVSERMLSQRLRLGKTPVRGAVQRLASEGLMTVEPRRGIVVSPQSIQDIIDLYEVRLVLEQLVVRQIAGKLAPDQVTHLQANLQKHQELAENPEPAQMLAVDFEFHRLLCAFHGNNHLTAVLGRIRDSLFPELRLSHMKSPQRVTEAIREHEAITDAIIAGDAAEAERLMARHLSSCQQFVMSRGIGNNSRL
jgi:DNA-binding GntR family transcriptional regulator